MIAGSRQARPCGSVGVYIFLTAPRLWGNIGLWLSVKVLLYLP